jgi:hypothetical protein
MGRSKQDSNARVGAGAHAPSNRWLKLPAAGLWYNVMQVGTGV